MKQENIALHWESMRTAPRDGTPFLVRDCHPELTEYWSCWYAYDDCEGGGWVLNDAVMELTEEEADSNLEWTPLPK